MRFLFAEAHEDYVCGQAVKPRRKRGLAAEGVDFAKKLKESFLGEVFGLEGVADHAQAEAVDAAGVLAIEDFEGGGVTALSAKDGGVEWRGDRLERARGRIWESFHGVSFGRGARIWIQYRHGGAAVIGACHCVVTTVQKRSQATVERLDGAAGIRIARGFIYLLLSTIFMTLASIRFFLTVR